MADFSFKITPNILLGSYTTSRLGEYALQYGNRYLVVLDPILKDTPVHEKVSSSLRERNIDYYIFDEVPQSANSKHLKRALDLAKKSFIKGIIAVGGSKTISLARSVSSLINEDKDLYAFLDGEVQPTSQGIPLLCVITTSCDPFVFTDKIPVFDARNNQLKILQSQPNLAKLVLIDSNTAVTMTDNQLTTSALSILCMLTECYLSQKANFFSDMLVEKALQIAATTMNGPESLSVTSTKEELYAQCGCLASLAAATSSTGHGTLLALCCNARYKVSKALTSAVLFPYLIEECATYKAQRLATIAKMLNICSQDTPDTEAAKAYADEIRQRLAKANLPGRLKDLSVTVEQFALVAQDAGKLNLINDLPKSMTSDDLFNLIKTAY